MRVAIPLIVSALLAADAIPQTPRLVKDIHPTGSNPHHFTAFAGKAFFAATDATYGRELWCSDGTAAGTRQVADLEAGAGSSDPFALQALGDKLLFLATTAATGIELFETDGTAAGTKLLKDIVAGAASGLSATTQLSPEIGGKVYFHQYRDLWVTDGTAAGTSKVYTATYPIAGSYGALPGTPGSFVFLIGSGFLGFADLWVSDGTPAGTKVIKTYFANLQLWLSPTAFKGVLLITSKGLWRTDGTAAGTIKVSDEAIQWLEYRGDKLLGMNAAGGLYESDGTAAGTKRITTISISSRLLAGSGHYGYFGSPADANYDTGTLHRTDGTAAGTEKIADYWVGSSVRVGSMLFLSAALHVSTPELHVLDLSATAWQVGAGCAAASRKPTLSASDPVLGTTQKIRFEDIKTGTTGVLVLGFPLATKADLGFGCEGWIDPLQPFWVTPWVQSSGTAHEMMLAIPASTALQDLRLAMQALVLWTEAPNGFDLTNAVLEVLGA